jgi:O-antigen chain-terminating methyltransferase
MLSANQNPVTPQNLPATQSGQLVLPEGKFPGFALPEAVLHSIPLPPEFDVLVQSAVKENSVKTIFPKFFNALFRRQGVVNKHTIQSLVSVGQSLSHLAREIEGRDRILEKLTAHLNAYGEHVQRGQLALANHFSAYGEHARQEHLALVNFVEQEKAISGTRTAALMTVTRTLDSRLGELQSLTAETNHRIEQVKESVERNGPILRELAARLAEAQTQTEHLSRQSQAALADSSQRLDGQISKLAEKFVETQTLVAAVRASARAAAEEVRRDVEAALITLSQRTDERMVELRDNLLRELASRLAETDQRTLDRLEEVRQQFVPIQTSQRAEMEEKITTLASRMDRFMVAMDDRMAGIEARLAKQETMAAQMDPVVSSLRAAGQANETVAAEVDTLRNDLLVLAGANAGVAKRQAATEATLGGTSAALDSLLPSLRIQLERLSGLGAGKRRQAIAHGANESVDAAQLLISDSFYVALEARFRGPRKVIRERQSRYLPLIEEARQRVELFPPTQQGPAAKHPLKRFHAKGGVLDLGCGRGEWLDLLKEHAVPSLGVDQNRFFLQMCRESGHDVIDADLIDFLRTAPDGSVAAVTSFHVIEHLPIPVFQEMAGHVARILRRGGIAIFETPNPTNMLTSGLNFLLDPTHLRPVHPQFASLVLETAGFASVRLEFLSPYDESYNVGSPEDPLAKKFNEYFHGPQEYAVIGIKP